MKSFVLTPGRIRRRTTRRRWLNGISNQQQLLCRTFWPHPLRKCTPVWRTTLHLNPWRLLLPQHNTLQKGWPPPQIRWKSNLTNPLVQSQRCRARGTITTVRGHVQTDTELNLKTDRLRLWEDVTTEPNERLIHSKHGGTNGLLAGSKQLIEGREIDVGFGDEGERRGHPQTGVEKWSELQEWFEEITMGQEGV